jgi:hypothetical protein
MKIKLLVFISLTAFAFFGCNKESTVDPDKISAHFYTQMSDLDKTILVKDLVAFNKLGNVLLTIEEQAFGNVDFTSITSRSEAESKGKEAVYSLLRVENEQEFWNKVVKPYQDNIRSFGSLMKKYEIQDRPAFLNYLIKKEAIEFTPLNTTAQLRVNKCRLGGYGAAYVSFWGDAALCTFTGPAIEICGGIVAVKFLATLAFVTYACS